MVLVLQDVLLVNGVPNPHLSRCIYQKNKTRLWSFRFFVLTFLILFHSFKRLAFHIRSQTILKSLPVLLVSGQYRYWNFTCPAYKTNRQEGRISGIFGVCIYSTRLQYTGYLTYKPQPEFKIDLEVCSFNKVPVTTLYWFTNSANTPTKDFTVSQDVLC